MADRRGPITTGTIWHVSDPHLTTKYRGGQAFGQDVPDGADLAPYHLEELDGVRRHFRKKKGRRTPAPDALVITGDLVDQGAWVKPDDVRRFIAELREAVGVSEKQVVIIPGNHDVNRETAQSPDAARRQWSRSEFYQTTGVYQTPSSTDGFVFLKEAGLAFLLADTVPYGGVPIGADRLAQALAGLLKEDAIQKAANIIRQELSTDTASIPVGDLTKLLDTKRLDDVDGATGGRRPLTILLGHYPLVPHPHGAIDFRKFHVPAGAGQAMKELAERGIHLVLHGHHHRFSVQSNELHDTPEFAFFNVGAPRWSGGAFGEDKGFNILTYAVNEHTGEARVVVERAHFEGSELVRTRSARIALPPRNTRPADLIRFTERVNLYGDARSDMWYSGLHTGTWRPRDDARQGELTHSIRCYVQALGSQMRPELEATILSHELDRPEFVPDATAILDADAGLSRAIQSPGDATVTAVPSVGGSTEEHANDSVIGSLVIRVPDAVERVSVAFRLNGNHSYATVLGDRVRSFGIPAQVPHLRFDQEALTCLVREPTQRLEVFIRMPEHAPSITDLEPRACVVVGEKEELLPADHLLSFTDAKIECWPRAKRVRLTVPNPMTGVSYGVVWRLADERGDVDGVDDAVREAEAVRSLLARARDEAALSERLKREVLGQFFADVLAVVDRMKLPVRAAVNITGREPEPVELALFVPKQPILQYKEYERLWRTNVARAAPRLHVAAASFPRPDDRFRAEMDAGVGVAGRSFAINGVSVHQDRRRMTPDPLAYNDYYLTLKRSDGTQLPRHNVLYAIPLQHWSVQSVVLGCLCIGVYEPQSSLDLSGIDPASIERDDLGRGKIASRVVLELGVKLCETLWRMRSQ